jgi:hypothetical protein
MSSYLAATLTPQVRALEEQTYGRSYRVEGAADRDPLGPEEREFIGRRDSFYLATVNSDGWPYLQHRGGPAGFLRVLDPHTLGFADLRGNRQLISAGNIGGNDKVSLLLMDYPRRMRLKVLGRARVLDPRDPSDWAEQLAPAGDLARRVERWIIVEVVGFDWNCPAYITPRYTEAEIIEARDSFLSRR